jgi:Holliday junction resolvase RusA-like endonuclease
VNSLLAPVPRVSLSVAGTPVPQGSKKAWYNPRLGAVQMYEDAGVRHKTWRALVTGEARQAMSDAGYVEPFTEPVSVLISFRFARPLNQYGTGRNARVVKDASRLHPDKPPDIDKLTRSILDSLTQVVWIDDGQVIALTARKQYVHRWEEDGVDIVVGTFLPTMGTFMTAQAAAQEAISGGKQ